MSWFHNRSRSCSFPILFNTLLVFIISFNYFTLIVLLIQMRLMSVSIVRRWLGFGGSVNLRTHTQLTKKKTQISCCSVQNINAGKSILTMWTNSCFRLSVCFYVFIGERERLISLIKVLLVDSGDNVQLDMSDVEIDSVKSDSVLTHILKHIHTHIHIHMNASKTCKW